MAGWSDGKPERSRATDREEEKMEEKREDRGQIRERKGDGAQKLEACGSLTAVSVSVFVCMLRACEEGFPA